MLEIKSQHLTWVWPKCKHMYYRNATDSLFCFINTTSTFIESCFNDHFGSHANFFYIWCAIFSNKYARKKKKKTLFFSEEYFLDLHWSPAFFTFWWYLGLLEQNGQLIEMNLSFVLMISLYFIWNSQKLKK